MSVLKIRDENGKFVCIPSLKGEKGDPGDAQGHSHQHAIGGNDELTPADIGAAYDMHGHSAEEVGAAPIGHTHTADEVGASPLGHTHDDRYYTETEVKALLADKAPKHTYGYDDIEAGSASNEPEGTLHLVIE